MKKIKITATVQIKADLKVVFDYVSNFANDVFWRAEITHSVLSDRSAGINSLITQTSFLSKKVPGYTTILRCTDFVMHEGIVCETVDNSRFWQRSLRVVAPANDGESTFTYQLEFDSAIVKHGLGFALPAFVVSFYAKQTMKKYLRRLKEILEVGK